MVLRSVSSVAGFDACRGRLRAYTAATAKMVANIDRMMDRESLTFWAMASNGEM